MRAIILRANPRPFRIGGIVGRVGSSRPRLQGQRQSDGWEKSGASFYRNLLFTKFGADLAYQESGEYSTIMAAAVSRVARRRPCAKAVGAS